MIVLFSTFLGMMQGEGASLIHFVNIPASIGGIPLAYGLACGDAMLTVAVLAIVITAPLGAFAITKICYFDKGCW